MSNCTTQEDIMVATKLDRERRLDELRQLRLLEGLCSGLSEAVTITRTRSTGGWEIVYVNDAFTRLTGYRLEEVMGKSPGVLQGPETDRGVLQDLSNRLAAGERFHGRTVNYRKSGEPFTMDWQVVTFHDEMGQERFHLALQREACE
jgi:PAS domain S-box-containing protein